MKLSTAGATLLLLLAGVVTCSQEPNVTLVEATGPESGLDVLVDYSPTVSDTGALLYLLAHPDVDVVAVTLPTTGEAGCDLGLRVTVGLLELMDQTEIPVACGAGVPQQAGTWPAEFLVGQEGLLTGLPEPAHEPLEVDAVELMAQVLEQSDDQVTILAVAPLTNLAELLDEHPDAVDAIQRIVIMGGAVDVAGNVPSADSEWNFFIDSAATGQVIGSSLPQTLVPLDATNDVPVPPDYLEMIHRAGQSPALDYLGSLGETFPSIAEGGFYFWDELAALVSVHSLAVEATDARLVVVDDGPSAGQTLHDEDGTQMTVIVGVPSPEAMYQEFLDRLSGPTP